MDQSDFGFPKSKRIVDLKLIEQVRKLVCMGCWGRPCDAHHVTSKGAGGHDVATNLMPLCRTCHALWHQDAGKFIRSGTSTRQWLEAAERFDILERYGVPRLPKAPSRKRRRPPATG